MKGRLPTVRDVRRFGCGVALAFAGVMLVSAARRILGLPPMPQAPVAVLAAAYLLGGAGFIVGMWVGEDLLRLRRSLAGLLAFVVFALAAFGGGWWLEQQRGAERIEQDHELQRAILEEPVERPAR